jgi:hypothetical protein
MNPKNPLADLSDDELVTQHFQRAVDTHFLSEMLRRHKNVTVELGRRMERLSRLLLVFTIVIAALTAVEVLSRVYLRG